MILDLGMSLQPHVGRYLLINVGPLFTALEGLQQLNHSATIRYLVILDLWGQNNLVLKNTDIHRHR